MNLSFEIVNEEDIHYLSNISDQRAKYNVERVETIKPKTVHVGQTHKEAV